MRRQITIDGTATWVDAYQINIDPTQFDYETQSRYDLRAVMNVPAATISTTTYAAVHAPIEIKLNVSNVNEAPNRTAQAAPADFDLRRRGRIVDLSLNGYWISEDDPDRNNLSYRLVQSVVGASAGQSTNAADYLSASLIGNTFQASAGASATLTPTGVRIKFDVYCREASTGVENSTPLTFYCDEVHSRALEDSPLTWGSTVPARLEFQVAEDIALPHLLRNNIFAESTVTDMSAEAGDISYSLREPTFWIERNTAFQWDGTISLGPGESKVYEMATAFVIMGPEKAGKTWTLQQSTDDASIVTIAISGTTATVTAAADITAADNTNFYLLGNDGNFIATYTGYIEGEAATGTIVARTTVSATGMLLNGAVPAVGEEPDIFYNTVTSVLSLDFYTGGTWTIPASVLFDASAAAEIYQIGSGTSASGINGTDLSIVGGNLQIVTGGAFHPSGTDQTAVIHGRLTGSPSTTASITILPYDET